ncbi:hypothetical protein [Streptomyces sp. NPDC046261]|uniref:hypothetical protein n=1 Tax=Streptomyces sp. NPDC046261 TaxID=3157200 RepID=UPI003402A204
MLSRTITAGAVGLAAAAVSLIGMTPAVAASSATAAGPSWSASHGTATVEGSSRWEKNAGGFGGAMAYEGALKNTGGDCYSAYFVIQQDLAPGPPIKVATQCGVGTKSASFKSGPFMPTTTVSVFVCKGDGFNDCGQRKIAR